MDFKSISQEVKDLDDKKGIVEAYANVYDFEDSDKDISVKGCFTKTVSENAKRIRVLHNHNPTLLLGVPLKMDASDNYGLLTVSQFNMKKALARDVFEDIKLTVEHGQNAELSIGYNVVRRSAKDQSKIEEYKLHEYSFLSSWAANELSITTALKSETDIIHEIKKLTEMYNRKYSDGRLSEIETLLKALDNATPPKDTLPDEPQIAEAIKKFKLSIQLQNYKNGN